MLYVIICYNYSYVIIDLNGEEIVHFMLKKLQKTIQQEFRTETVMKKKGNKLHAKWKACINSFNSWIDKKYLA